MLLIVKEFGYYYFLQCTTQSKFPHIAIECNGGGWIKNIRGYYDMGNIIFNLGCYLPSFIGSSN